jgi:hypothetical protein
MGVPEVPVIRSLSLCLLFAAACGPSALGDAHTESTGAETSGATSDAPSPAIVVLAFDGAMLELGDVDDATRGVTSDPGLVGTYAPASSAVDRILVLADIRDMLAPLDLAVVPAIPHPARYSMIVVTDTQPAGYPDAAWVARLDREGVVLDLVDADVGVVIAHDTDAAVRGIPAVIGRSLGLEPVELDEITDVTPDDTESLSYGDGTGG